MDSRYGVGSWGNGPRYTLSLADSASEVAEAQRLRHRVFLAGGAIGAGVPENSESSIEADEFDRSVCGPPASDPIFATVDFLVALPLQSASFRHAERIVRKRRAA